MLLHANTITGNTIAFPFFVSLRRCLEIVIYWVKQESRIVIYMTSIDVPLPKENILVFKYTYRQCTEKES
jgi:hypothetical protein